MCVEKSPVAGAGVRLESGGAEHVFMNNGCALPHSALRGKTDSEVKQSFLGLWSQSLQRSQEITNILQSSNYIAFEMLKALKKAALQIVRHVIKSGC